MKIKDKSRILFLGDSITDVKFNKRQRITIGGKDVYALQTARELKKRFSALTFSFSGIASNRTYHVYDRFTKDCVNFKPDYVFMLIGVNDAWEHYVPEQYPPLLRPMEPHIKEIYRRFHDELPDTKIMVLLPFMIDAVPEKLPFHKVLDEYREVLRRYAEENGAEIIDLQAVFNEAQKTTEPKLLARDGIHPTNLGHSVIMKAIMEQIDNC